MTTRKDHPSLPKLKQELARGRLPRREFLRYATALGMSAGAAYTLAGVAPLRRAHAQEIPTGGTITIGMRVQEVTSPHALNWVQPGNVTTQVIQTLTRIDQDNAVIPHLAAGWDVSDDLRSWTFSLREGLTYHDGRPFLADDVIWNFNHILAPDTGSSAIGLVKSYLLNDVDTGEVDDDGNPRMTTEIWDANAFEKIDDLTVRLNLKEPTITVAEDLFFYNMTMADPEENGSFGVGSNGTGPFELVEHEVGVRSVLRARQDYWGDGPYVDELIYLDLGDDPSAWISAVASRQVHGLYQLDGQFIPAVEGMPHAEVHEAQTSATSVVQMKVMEPPFDDARVRLAMRLGIDPEAVLQLSLQGRGLPAEHHFVCQIHPEYFPLPKMERDPERARELLAEAGYPDGIDVEMACKGDPAWELAAVQVMAEQYAEAGIRVSINNMPSSAFWDQWDKVPLGFVEWAHRSNGLAVLNLGFRSGVPWNAPEYANPELDDLLTQAAGTLDLDDRKALFEHIERIMQEDGPIAQPCWRAITTVFDTAVVNFKMHPMYFFFGEEMGIEA